MVSGAVTVSPNPIGPQGRTARNVPQGTNKLANILGFRNFNKLANILGFRNFNKIAKLLRFRNLKKN